MRRLFWFGAGVAAGVAVTRKINETTRRATPAGMAEQLGGAMRDLADSVGSFGAEVRAGMQEREQELDEAAREPAGSDPGRPPAVRGLDHNGAPRPATSSARGSSDASGGSAAASRRARRAER